MAYHNSDFQKCNWYIFHLPLEYIHHNFKIFLWFGIHMVIDDSLIECLSCFRHWAYNGNRHGAVLVCDKSDMPHGDVEPNHSFPWILADCCTVLSYSWPVFSLTDVFEIVWFVGFFPLHAVILFLLVIMFFSFLSYCICLLHGNFSKLPEQSNFFSLLFLFSHFFTVANGNQISKY